MAENNIKVELGNETVVELEPEFGPEVTMRAAEMSQVPADMSHAEYLLLNIATVMTLTISVQRVADPMIKREADKEPKTVESLTEKAHGVKGILMAFRKAFTDDEWTQLGEAIAVVYPKAKKLPAFKVLV
jgi:hypothetical protein